MICPGLPGQFRRAMLTLCLLLLVQVGPALAGSVRLYWDPNTEPDLAGYVLVYGNASGVYTTSVTLPASAVTHEFVDLPNGTYYFAVRAFNAANAQSGYSNEVRVVVISTPSISSVSPLERSSRKAAAKSRSPERISEPGPWCRSARSRRRSPLRRRRPSR